MSANEDTVVNRIAGARAGDGAQVAAAGHGAGREEPAVGPRRLLQELRALQLRHLAGARPRRPRPRRARRAPRAPRAPRRRQETRHQRQARVPREVSPRAPV